MLGLITCFFNPTNSQILKRNYSEFRKRLDCPITTVELAFGDQSFFIEDSIKIRGNNRHIMFQKERLLNIALASLPDSIDKVAWLDADIIFNNPNWYRDTEAALDQFPVVQLFDEFFELNHGKAFANQSLGIGKIIETQGSKRSWSEGMVKIGIAWAAQRKVLREGFFDRHILGSGDRLFLNACMSWWDCPRIQWLPPRLRKEFLDWGLAISQEVCGKVGYIHGKVQHLPHGSTEGRAYEKRSQILVRAQFNPETDICLDENGVYKFTSANPELMQDILLYFSKRNEDRIG